MNRAAGPLVAQVAAEAVPFVKVGGLADVAGALHAGLRAAGRCVLFLPLHRPVREAVPDRRRTAALPGGAAVEESPSHPGVYFVRHDASFDRDGVYGPPGGGGYPDDLRRNALFCRAVLEACRALGLDVSVFHCHDWHTALLPLYLQLFHRDALPAAGTLFTIHNLAYQGIFPAAGFGDLGLPARFFSMDELEFYGSVNAMKAGIVHADLVSTVSPRYAREILTPEFGCRLDPLLRGLREPPAGILNGLDRSLWNPAADPAIAAPFDSPPDKAPNKAALLAELRLESAAAGPLFGWVGRLVEQKGADLAAGAAAALADAGGTLAVLGDGESALAARFAGLARSRPGRIAFVRGFDDALARRIYAASDFFLMPSRFEPCGIGQMIALSYGAVPVVSRVGGLADTVVPADAGGWGIVFEGGADGFAAALAAARALYADRPALLRAAARGMALDFSWAPALDAYRRLYRRVRPPGAG